MIDLETAHEILLSMPDAIEDTHFDKPSYKRKGKIFATFNIENKWVTVKFMPEQQAEFCENEAFCEVPNKWGKLGWTHIDLNKVRKNDFIEAIKIAWGNVVLKKK